VYYEQPEVQCERMYDQCRKQVLLTMRKLPFASLLGKYMLVLLERFLSLEKRFLKALQHSIIDTIALIIGTHRCECLTATAAAGIPECRHNTDQYRAIPKAWRRQRQGDPRAFLSPLGQDHVKL
jgi:hypothetical protein